ncbi:NAD(P)-dependent dehydrogenase (short-subunit alcohol dehydrogenase family) [Saccharothrix saharensis]|uniref:NAD(P)-dependent dehydrogenase (Short-subunit alcohol dehydrogenase family) n=1 Tax=Saccharothrix saharensis TaxID=571190 RepID=A0A543JGQ8_9PSEU|nr:SDR family oxidoreductase [Saccharothrix saharensis]TQM82025.1 NAD(P)-dependent dehydrogenase (short-subunit alcohol dehydrogenase family) [Saccharothrix saharensis]
MERRVAVVTGAAQGIGARVAEVLRGDGYEVVGFDLVETEGGVVGDVSSPADVARVAERVGERVDVLVNNAGIAGIVPFEDTSLEQWERMVAVNLTGPFLLTQALGRVMLARGRGAVVNIASVAGLRGVADRAAYNTTKHGLIGMTRTLAVEWGGRGVRVNAVCPGWVKTEMDVESQAGGHYGDHDITDHVPMGRFAVPDDIAQAVAFLADPDRSGFVNGVALPVDGGWTADGSWQSLRLSKR